MTCWRTLLDKWFYLCVVTHDLLKVVPLQALVTRNTRCCSCSSCFFTDSIPMIQKGREHTLHIQTFLFFKFYRGGKMSWTAIPDVWNSAWHIISTSHLYRHHYYCSWHDRYHLLDSIACNYSPKWILQWPYCFLDMFSNIALEPQIYVPLLAYVKITQICCRKCCSKIVLNSEIWHKSWEVHKINIQVNDLLPTEQRHDPLRSRNRNCPLCGSALHVFYSMIKIVYIWLLYVNSSVCRNKPILLFECNSFIC